MEKLNKQFAMPVLIEGILAMREDIDSVLETLTIMNNKKLVKSIERGLRDIKKSKVFSFDEIKAIHEKLRGL